MTASTVYQTREDWLNAMVDEFRALFFNGTLAPELPRVRVSCGFPKGRAAAIGQCWSSSCSGDETFEIFIHPGQADALRVGDILLHECIHAAVGLDCKHRGAFRSAAIRCGLTGEMRATIATPQLAAQLQTLIDQIGDYPHAQLMAANGAKKQGTRLLKLQCPECGMIIRTTQKWLEDSGVPLCGTCNREFEQG